VATPTSFKADIRPLFTEMDLEHMNGIIDLTSYDDVKTHAQDILGRLTAKDQTRLMPPPMSRGGDGPWSPERILLFQSWVNDGCQP